MELDLDFWRELEEHFSSNNKEELRQYFEDFLAKNHRDHRLTYVFVHAYNVIKTAKLIGSSWGECLEHMLASISLPSDDVTKFCLAFMAMDNLGEEILAESPPEESLKESKEKDMGADTSYSVDQEPVKSWDEYFYNVAVQVARNSKCFSRKIGAVLVRDQVIISTGYNGPPRGIPTCDKRWKIDPAFIEKYQTKDYDFDKDLKGKCPRYVIGAKSGQMMHICPAGHAEENTVLNCAMLGISTKGATMYMTCGIPCGKCMVKIINSGVKELVVTKFTYYDETSRYLLANSDVKARLFDFIL